MTAAEHVYRLALRAYPREYRRERGPEILATLADMQGGRAAPDPRQVAGLLAAGVRRRGAEATGATRAGVWMEGCRLAALALLLLSAAASLRPIALDTWYSRLGFVWPSMPFTAAPPMAAGGLARWLVAALLPLVAAAAICRRRDAIAVACSLLAAGLFLGGQIGTGLLEGVGYPAGQDWLGSAYRVGAAIFLAAPAALLLAGVGRGRAPARRSLAWLAVPFAVAALSIGFYLTTLTFWPLGALVVAWFLAGRLAPHLAVATFALLVPAVAYVLPTAIGAAGTYEYATAVVAGAAALALASLTSALALDADAELDGPAV